MSIKIWCEKCAGDGTISIDAGCGCCYEDAPCPVCFGKSYIEKGCENCRHVGICLEAVQRDEEGCFGVTFCTAWEKKDD